MLAVWPRWLLRRVLYAIGLSAPVRLVHHPRPATLTSVSEDGSKRTTTLLEVLEKCPSLLGKLTAWYTPTSWLVSGHLATIACTVFKYTYDPVTYTRELIRVPDGGTLAVDFAPPIEKEDQLDSRPILVVSHGLTGGSHESYVRNVLAIVTRPVEEGGLGWRAAVVNSRGCAGSQITSQKLYSGAVTDDLRCALAFISHFAPKAPLYGIGFSLGANQMAKLVGEEATDCPLNGAVVLGAPFDFVRGHVALCSSWIRMVYSKAMAKNLKTLLARHADTFRSHPKLDFGAIFGNPNMSLFEFDSLVTAPLAGFGTAVEYYRAASASNVIANADVPLLSISALDDPIVDCDGIPFDAAKTNPNLIFATTRHGGHLGWHEGIFRPRRWVAKPVVEFLKALHEANPHPRAPRETVPKREIAKMPQIGDEMVVLKGREEEIGFQRVKVEEHAAKGGEPIDVDEGLTRGL
ncbi:hypothetical protein JCM8547_003232 [Rhodosporidiobolus lusitaniae]